MRLSVPLPDGQTNIHVEVYYPDVQTRYSKTEVMAGVREVRVKLPAEQEKCLIRVFPVQDSEPLSNGYVYLDGQLHPYRPEDQLSTAGASITDEPVESVEESDEPPAEIVEEVHGVALDMGEPLELDSSPGLVVVTEAGIEPLEDEDSAELEDEPDE
jgi:hypothetical protein